LEENNKYPGVQQAEFADCMAAIRCMASLLKEGKHSLQEGLGTDFRSCFFIQSENMTWAWLG